MSKDSSRNLEIYFSIRNPVLKRPFFFHHIPKTAGSSLRYVVRRWLLDAGCNSLVIQDAAKELSVSWPESVVSQIRAAYSLGRVEAVLSHYTAAVADEFPERVVALVRDPDEQLVSNLYFHPSLVKSKIRVVFKNPLVNNSQFRSLTGQDCPVFAPKSNRELRRWRQVIDRLEDSFQLYRSDGYSEVLRECRETYGMEGLREGPRRKVRRSRSDVDLRIAQIVVEATQTDPVWLDRMLYDRVCRSNLARGHL